jgi:hypothetical protein
MSNKLLKSGFREGFLKKKHAVKKRIWRRRWFVLTNDKLWYYTEKVLLWNIIKQNIKFVMQDLVQNFAEADPPKKLFITIIYL